MNLTLPRSLRRHLLFLGLAPLACAAFYAPPACAAVVTDPALPTNLPDVGATTPLVALAYSPDAATVYTIGDQGEFLARDAQTGAIAFRGEIGSDVVQLRVLPDGSLLVGRSIGTVEHFSKPIAGHPLASTQIFAGPEVEAQRGDTKPFFSKLLFDLKLGTFSISPDAKILAVTTIETAYEFHDPGDDRPRTRERGAVTARIRLWDLTDGTLVRELATLPITTPGFGAQQSLQLAWSDATTLAVALPEVAVKRFDIATGELKSEWKPPADAKPVIADTQAAERERRQRSLPQGMRDRIARSPIPPPPAGDTGFGNVQAISRDGNFVLANIPLAGWYLWDVRDNSNHLLERSERLTQGEEAQFSSDGSLVAMRSGAGFWLWKTDGSQIGFARIPAGDYSGLAFAPDVQTIALGDKNGVARIWKTSAPLSKQAQTTLTGYFEPWFQLSSTPGGLLAGTARGVAALDANGVRWFENTPLESPEPIPTTLLTPPRQEVIAFAIAPDGKTWAESVTLNGYSTTLSNRGIPRGELRGRDAQTGQILWHLTDSDNFKTVNLLRFLPDSTLLTGKEGRGRSFGPQDTSLVGLQARDGKTGETKPFDITWGQKVGQREPRSIAVLEPSADGKTLVLSSGSGGEGVQYVDLTTKTVRGSFGANTDFGRALWSVSADGKWLAGNLRGTLGLWDISGTRPNSGLAPDIQLLANGAVPVTALQFGPTGVLAVGLSDGRVLTWAPPFAAGVTPTWETTAGRAIDSLAFSVDGKTLWSGDERGDLKARDAQTGILQDTLRLLPPQKENGTPAWVKWNAAGNIENTAP